MPRNKCVLQICFQFSFIYQKLVHRCIAPEMTIYSQRPLKTTWSEVFTSSLHTYHCNVQRQYVALQDCLFTGVHPALNVNHTRTPWMWSTPPAVTHDDAISRLLSSVIARFLQSSLSASHLLLLRRQQLTVPRGWGVGSQPLLRLFTFSKQQTSLLFKFVIVRRR